jgi:hypothetical protein
VEPAHPVSMRGEFIHLQILRTYYPELAFLLLHRAVP